MKTRTTESLATSLRKSDEWIPEIVEELCTRAGMASEYSAADGETFEAVVLAAAEKLGVEI